MDVEFLIRAHRNALDYLDEILAQDEGKPVAAVYNHDKTDTPHLRWMIDEIRTNKDMPLDKIARWVGFIQGVMVMREMITVDGERNRTRGIFDSRLKERMQDGLLMTTLKEELEIARSIWGKKTLWYCESQRDIWAKVPYLTLQADGLSGWSDTYSVCYNYGLWRIQSSTRDGYYRLCVDCGTGKLMWGEREADPQSVFDIDLDDLDAQSIVDDLLADIANYKAQGADHSIYFNKYPLNWREKKAKELRLGETYWRELAIPKPSFSPCD
jgi:hypothetical protein